MPTYFKCKRRKIGLCLLLLSCWLTLMLARSFWIEDFISFQTGPATIDGLLVSEHRILWARFRWKKSFSRPIRWATDRKSIEPYTFFHRLNVKWHDRILGLERAGYTGQDETDPRFVFFSMWAVSYWSLLVPLFPLSIVLICWPVRETAMQPPIESETRA